MMSERKVEKMQKKEKNNNQIDATSYYQLPSGRFLEDFIYAKSLNFNMGSAVKYLWRAGRKDGEAYEKDLAKYRHYVRFEAKCRNQDKPNVRLVEKEVKRLINEALEWGFEGNGGSEEGNPTV